MYSCTHRFSIRIIRREKLQVFVDVIIEVDLPTMWRQTLEVAAQPTDHLAGLMYSVA
jgi:hypothetical protein